MSPQDYCTQKAAKSGSSFYYSFLFLDHSRREAIIALYAFCREVDDIVDGSTNTDVAKVKLTWWQKELERIWDGNPQHPVARALAVSVERYGLEKKYFDLIIEGMMMDLIQTRYATFEDLKSYCYRVASAVGILSARIFGFKHKDTLIFAEKLGLALQITNILRDIKEDYDRDRIYLPLSTLENANINPSDLLTYIGTQKYDYMVREQAQLANGLYESAIANLPEDDRAAQRAGLIMCEIYRKILSRISDAPSKAFNKRQSLAPIHKLWIAFRVWSRES